MLEIAADTQVLLLDDDEHLRTALCQTFALAGLRVQACASAQGLLTALAPQWAGGG